MPKFRVMGVAISSGRIGYVVLSGEDKLIDWGVSVAASKSPEKAKARVRDWLDEIDPGAVVTEQIGSNSRKRGQSVELMRAVFEAIKASSAVNVTTTKVRHHKDKYREAQALAEEFPELLPRVAKKPKAWLTEPRRMILFEALALALRLRETRELPDKD